MCGRIRQARSLNEYQEHLRWNPYTALEVDDGPKFNVPPGARPITLHRLNNSAEHADRMVWGYRPAGYHRGPVSNARLDSVLEGSRFWKPLLHRRIIVPVDGWYEWSGEKGQKQPWYISACDGEPILMAGLTGWQPGREDGPEAGFAILTDDTAGKMVDLHDRRPICLTVDDALAWLDDTLTVEEALQHLSTPRPESAFHWWKVTPAMGDSRYQLPDASEPVGMQ